MPLTHQTIPQFFNGVSQQAPNLRRTSQVASQINCFSSIADGVIPRAPSEHQGEVSATPLGNVYHHTIDRDDTEQFNVIIEDGAIQVYDMEGVAQTVSYPAGTAYLAATDPKSDFEAITIKDFTFILNKSVVTAKGSAGSAGSLTRTLQSFSNLKDTSDADVVGSFYKIEGDENNSFTAYYLEKTINNAGTDADTYVETVDPTLTQNSIDASTMPHQLVRTAPSTFEFQEVSWVDRTVGDETTNPYPSFIGNTINEMFLWRDRFGFLSGDGVVLSEQSAANYFNFFRTTVTQLLPSDPIDVSANIREVTNLLYAVPFDKNLILFTDSLQFTMGDSDLLTPDNVEIKPTTNFSTSTKARPVLAGRNVYFPFERTNFTGYRELFVDSDSLQTDAADITKHIPKYVPKDVFKNVASSNEDYLLCLSEQTPNIVYVYQWYWGSSSQGLTKLQSAWHYWDFGTGSKVLNVDLIGNVIHLIIERESKVYLETIDMAAKNFESGLAFQIKLDRRVSVTGVYNAGTNETTWTLPYSTTSDVVVVRDGGFTLDAGLPVNTATKTSGTTITAPGDLTESSCVIGIETYRELTLSPFFLATSTQGGSVSRLGGKLKISKMKLSYADSAFFQVSVTPKARATRTRTFSPAIGADESVIGSIVPSTGVFSFPVFSQGDSAEIKVTSSSYLPFAITSGEWEGFYHSVFK